MSLRRKWEPERLGQVDAAEGGACRVCGGSVAKGDPIWRWLWRSSTVGHLACGWFTTRDADGVTALRALGDMRTMPAADALTRAHELGLVVAARRPDGGTDWSLSPVGKLLLRQLRKAAA